MSNITIRAAIETSADYASLASAAHARPATASGALAPPVVPAGINVESLERAVDTVNRMLDPLARSLRFNLDGMTGTTIVNLVDKETGKVLRQVPSTEMLSIGRALERVQGMLISERA